jgi:DNA-binding GntR family transcriptional regulator
VATQELRRVERVTGRTSDLVLGELATAIRELRLPPGQAISETEIATALGVSRTPVREAMSRLAENGLVRVVPQVGTRVAPIRLDDLREAQFIREALEVAVYDTACGRPDADAGGMAKALTAQRAAHRAGDFPSFFTADEAFHAALFEAAGHAGTWDAVQRAKFHLDRVRRLAAAPLSVSRLIGEHKAIHEALCRRDPAGRDLVVAHARRVLEYAPALSQQFPDYFED